MNKFNYTYYIQKVFITSILFICKCLRASHTAKNNNHNKSKMFVFIFFWNGFLYFSSISRRKSEFFKMGFWYIKFSIQITKFSMVFLFYPLIRLNERDAAIENVKIDCQTFSSISVELFFYVCLNRRNTDMLDSGNN